MHKVYLEGSRFLNRLMIFRFIEVYVVRLVRYRWVIPQRIQGERHCARPVFVVNLPSKTGRWWFIDYGIEDSDGGGLPEHRLDKILGQHRFRSSHTSQLITFNESGRSIYTHTSEFLAHSWQ